MSVLGLIPAKGGSQRLARKNVRAFGGRPLLGWAIDAALASGVIDRLILSTEDEAIADTARQLGADVPFLRPPELARDPAGVVDVALHALASLREVGATYDTLIVLLPTCPLRTAEDIRNAFAVYRDSGTRFLMSVTRSDHNPFNAMTLGTDGGLDFCFPERVGAKPGTLPATYRANGAIHVLDVPAFEAARSYYVRPLAAYVMPPERSVDIDDEVGFRLAELYLPGSRPT